jgi:hypothetical protein
MHKRLREQGLTERQGCAMLKPQDTIQQWLRQALHAQLDEVSHEELPRRWVELIRHLDEQERRQAEDQGSERKLEAQRRECGN